MSNTYNIYTEMITKQVPNIDFNFKLNNSDMKRIAIHLDDSIFIEGKCSLWTGYITNNDKKNKAPYVNFFFKKKKTALHRLLYKNFVGTLGSDEYIRYKCKHKGVCCNVYCLEKHKYIQKQPKDHLEPQLKNIIPAKQVLEIDFNTPPLKKKPSSSKLSSPPLLEPIPE